MFEAVNGSMGGLGPSSAVSLPYSHTKLALSKRHAASLFFQKPPRSSFLGRGQHLLPCKHVGGRSAGGQRTKAQHQTASAEHEEQVPAGGSKTGLQDPPRALILYPFPLPRLLCLTYIHLAKRLTSDAAQVSAGSV